MGNVYQYVKRLSMKNRIVLKVSYNDIVYGIPSTYISDEDYSKVSLIDILPQSGDEFLVEALNEHMNTISKIMDVRDNDVLKLLVEKLYKDTDIKLMRINIVEDHIPAFVIGTQFDQ